MKPETFNLKPSTTAAIYRRVSTDHQDSSLEQQERRVNDYAQFKLLDVREGLTFSDPDTSGGTDLAGRTGGRALLNRLKLGDVKHLIVAKVDRIGRNVRDGMATLEFLKEHGITLHIVNIGGESISTQGHIGKLILTLMFAFAEWELGEIRDRTQTTMTHKFNAGDLTGNVPFGYVCRYTFADGKSLVSDVAMKVADLADCTRQHGAVTGKKLEAEPIEQAIIREMAALRAVKYIPPGEISLVHTSYKAVAEEMNQRGYLTKQGHPWQSGNVASVLKSRHTKRLLQTSV